MSARNKRRRKKVNVPRHFDCGAELSFTAGTDASEGGEPKLPTLHILANTGKPMRVKGFPYPLIVDMRGAFFANDPTPIIEDHEGQLRLGHTTEQVVIPHGKTEIVGGKTFEGPAIAVFGPVSSSKQNAKEFVTDAGRGFPFQSSIGGDPIQATFVAEGEEATINGQVWKGPLIWSKKTKIREITAAVLGADGDTKTAVAATFDPQEIVDMTFEEFVASLGFEMDSLSEDQEKNLKAMYSKQRTPVPDSEPAPTGGPSPEQRKLQAAETRRVNSINLISTRNQKLMTAGKGGSAVVVLEDGDKKFDLNELQAHAIENDWTPEQFEVHVLRAEYPEPEGGPSIHSKKLDMEGPAISAAILRAMGVPGRRKNRVSGEEYGLETMYKPEVLEESHRPQYRGMHSIQALLDVQIRAAGRYFSGHSRSGTDFIASAVEAWNEIKASGFSTLNIPNILEDVMHKAALSSFNSVEAVWPFICGRRPLNDFKVHNLYRLEFDGSWRKVAVDGELKHISLTDTKYTLQAESYGAMIAIDRKTIRNDDLGMAVQKARSLGTLGGQRIEESVFVLLLSNPGSFFSAGNGNLRTGAGSALSISSLEDARQDFRDQVINGKPVGISPSIMLVPSTLETTANRLWAEERLEVGGGNTDTGLVFINNPHRGLFRPYISPWLNNTSITDQDGQAITGQTDTQWYLFAGPENPQGSAIAIGFLDGIETPFFDQEETQFNIPGGIQMRSYLDWGVAMHVTQLAHKSAGA